MSLDEASLLSGLQNDKDLQELIVSEQNKMQFQNEINKFTDICWDKCVPDKMSSKFDRKTESCLNNCVGRFIDTSIIVTKLFQQQIQKMTSR